MTPGRIDLKVVHDRLQIVAACLGALRELPQQTLSAFLSDSRNPAAADSHLRRATEALFDIARHLLSRAHGLGALEYRDVARHAQEKGLIRDPDLARRFREIAGYRNRLAHYYDEVTPAELHGILKGRLGDVEAIAEALKRVAAELSTRAGA